MSGTNDHSTAKKDGTSRQPPEQPLHEDKLPPAGVGGPTSPAGTDRGEAPESGGYDRRPPISMPDNAKGGYGTG